MMLDNFLEVTCPDCQTSARYYPMDGCIECLSDKCSKIRSKMGGRWKFANWQLVLGVIGEIRRV